MKERFLAVILCLATLLTMVPATNVVAVGTQTTEYVNYGAAIGNTAEFNVYFPVPITDDPKSVDNPWGTDCEFLSEPDVPAGYLMVITDYYCAPDGSLWYKVSAAPGYAPIEKLQSYPWIYQDDVDSPMGASLILHNSSRNTVFDKNGNVITSARIGLYDTVTLECRSTLIGKPSYQWQIQVGDEWVDIVGEDTASIGVKFTMLSSAMNADQQVKVRCVSQSGSQKVTGDPITFYVDTYFDYDSYVHPEKPEPEAPQEKVLRSGSSSEGINAQAEEECYIMVQYLFEDGTQAANSYVAEVPVGVESTITAVFPYVQGYLPYYDGVQQDDLTITDVFTKNEVYTVLYQPTYVTYTVDIHFQNVDNDLYSFYDSRTYEGLTGTQVPLNTQADFEGMQELLHETPVIAADGSTRVEVYYDRIYYMTRVHLDGGFGVYSVYARYGADLQSHLSAPTRPGYSFVGWDEYTVDGDNDGVPDSGNNGIADTVYPTVPAKNLAYVALWQENPTAQVNIVFWGENPNDEGYSYLSTEELQVKPGTVLTYALSGGYACGLTEHTHGTGDCIINCEFEDHIHSYEQGCYGNCTYNHTHVAGCYNVRYGYNTQVNLTAVTNANTIDDIETGTLWGNNVVRLGSRNNYRYYMKLDGIWYQLTRNNGITINSDTTVNVSYTNSCQGSHIHNNGCLSCTIHTHSGTCYECVAHTHSQTNCGYPQFDGYDANLWEFKESETVVVDRDGTTVLNVKFARKKFKIDFRTGTNSNTTIYTIEEKWGADLSSHWPIKGTNGITYDEGQRWDPRNSSIYNEVLVYIAIMPKESFYLVVDPSNQNTYIMHYMVEVLPGEDATDIREFQGRTFKELFEPVKANYNYLTRNEDFLDLEGYEQLGSDPAFRNNQIDIGGGGDVYFYYTRQSNVLEFYSGSDVARTEAMDFGQSLREFAAYEPPLPEEYEVGSHEFDGWYLNPDCTGEEVDLSTATMPAGSLALYAKWVPNYHTVRVVLQKNDDGVYGPEDSVLTTESVEVRHGNIVFSDADVKVPPTPENGLYKFLGWFYMNNGVEMMWDFEDRPVVKDTVIYAKWSSEVMVPYTIYYKDTQGNEVAPPLISSSLAGYYLTVDAKVGNELNLEYRNKYFPQTVSHSIPLNIENAETGVEYTFVYEKAESKKYYVHYVDADNGDAELSPTEEKDSELAIVTETYKYVEGYVPDEYQKSLILSANEDENHLYFYYTKADDKGVWFVGHYVENKDVPGSYDTHSTDGDVTALGVEIQAEWPVDLSKEGFIFSHATVNDGTGEKTVSSLEAAKGAVTAKGLEIKVHYNRIKYPYKIVYRNKDTGQEIRDPDVFTDDDMEPYGKIVTVTSLPTIDGYEYASSSSCTIVKDGPDNITKNIIYVYYTEQTVRIDFKVVGPDGCGTVNPESLSVKYISDTSATAQAIPTENFRFVGWYYDQACTNPIVTSDKLTPTGEMLILQRGDGWAPATYYAKFEPGTADLTIKRENAENGQVYVYKVTNTVSNLTIYVTITGNGQVTIHDLTMGDYTVTQQNGWSWRHDDPAQNVSLQNADGATVTFDGDASNDQWLNGNSELVENKRG